MAVNGTRTIEHTPLHKLLRKSSVDSRPDPRSDVHENSKDRTLNRHGSRSDSTNCGSVCSRDYAGCRI